MKKIINSLKSLEITCTKLERSGKYLLRERMLYLWTIITHVGFEVLTAVVMKSLSSGI
jgi:hypothetical protein